MPKSGERFTRKQILESYQHDHLDLYWVIVKGRQIQALCLRSNFNPNLRSNPAEVWVGSDQPTKDWGDILANDTARVPIYEKTDDQETFTYLGKFEILSRSATDEELNNARQAIQSQHQRGLSRIVFLKKV